MTELPLYEFEFSDTRVRVWDFGQLTPQELVELKITENCFFVQVMTLTDVETFELYPGEYAEWLTKPEISQELIHLIADKIEKITL